MNVRTISVFLCVLLLGTAVDAQVRDEMLLRRADRGKVGINPEEVVSFKADVELDKALQSLSELSKKLTTKPIVFDPEFLKGKTIGVDIVQMPWRTAMETILRSAGLWYREMPDYFQLVTPQGVALGTPQQQQQQQPVQPTPGQELPSQPVQQPITGYPQMTPADSALQLSKEREVTISAVFLEINTSMLKESGVSFSIFRSSATDWNLGVEFQAADNVTSEIFGITASTSPGQLEVDVTTALKIFESNAIGEIIAQPQVTVRSGQKGRVQVGEDFSIKQRTISGDVTEVFVSTGTILEVTPKVYTYEGMDFIDITLAVERSSLIDPATSRINKTKADSRLLLLNGEQNYVGGLFLNDENVVREGIPLLKDLPWWVLGLRYIFGYDRVQVTKKELLVLLKAELVPTLEERVTQKARNIIDDKLKEGRSDLKKNSQLNRD